MIRVGTITYTKGKKNFPDIVGYKRIEVMTPSTRYGSLSPYSLKDEEGRIMENWWQSRKVYELVIRSKQRKSRWDSTVIWEWPGERHLLDGEITESYWVWRKALESNPEPVRYPVGRRNMGMCKFAMDDDGKERLDYIQSRKRLYVKKYVELVKQQRQYCELLGMTRNGVKLNIVEVDGPKDCDYYKEKYGVDDTFISNRTIECNKDNLRIMLNDPKHPFGHGYCLAMALMDDMGSDVLELLDE